MFFVLLDLIDLFVQKKYFEFFFTIISGLGLAFLFIFYACHGVNGC